MNQIKSLNLVIRQFNTDDLDAIHAYASDSEVTKYMLFGPNTIDETRAFLDHVINHEYKAIPQRSFEYAIEYNHHLIGAVSIHFNETFEEAEIGWVINPLYQRQGFAYEAASTLINWAAEHYPLKKVIAHCDDRNISSYKLMEKLGMHLECIHKDVKIVKKDGVHLREERLYSMNITKKGN
ncbi:MAG: GNAT family N-acetyltransferase [bacterium]